MRGLRGMLLSPCAVLLTMAGCSKAPAPAAPSAPETTLSDATPAPPAAPPATAEQPAESGLAIKRGIVTLVPERNTFRPCGEQGDLLMIDQSDGVLAREFAGEKDADGTEQPLKLYVEAYGERSTDQPPAGGAGTFILEEALYAAPDGQTHGCDAPAQTYIVAARGTEPFWSVEVTDAALLWHQPDEPKEISITAPQTQNSEGAVSYTAINEDHKIELLIEAQACRDDMSGEYFAYTARATLDGKQYTGCARVGK